MNVFIDMTGQRFGRLFVLEPVENFGGPRKWHCICDCGNIVDIRGSHMRAGRSKSCGCLNKEMTIARSFKHGRTHTPEHKTWVNIRGRCEDPKNISYKYYGAKGIKVCARWQTFANFFADMGLRPSKDHSIDRLDGTKDYHPGNCRWATEIEQQNNKASNRMITWLGMKKSVSEWTRWRGFKRGTIQSRLQNGWSEHAAVNLPLQRIFK